MIGLLLRPLFLLADRVRRRARRRHVGIAHAQALGRTGEDMAHRHLERVGLVVVARNYRTPGGSAEVDLIAREGEVLVFVEVKTRETDEFGTPDRAIDSVKQSKIRRAALAYLRRSGHDPARVRFDIISIVTSAAASSNAARLEHFRDAWSF